MAQKLDYTLPFNDLTQYVPQNLRNEVINGLLDNLFNRQMTHDESIPLYGYIGRKPSSTDDRTIRIPQINPDRDINAVVPIFNFTLGTKRYAFTVQDLINKARAIGISQAGLNWLYTQANNYVPPIDIDKFSNFYNYFWISSALTATPNTPWNEELLPEYYVIAKPKNSDLDKLNVVVASTTSLIRTGTGFNDQDFTLTFIDPLTFKIKANNSLGSYHTFGANASSSVGGGPAQYDQYTFSLTTASLEQTYENSFQFDVQGPSGTVTLVKFKIVRDPIYDSDGNWIGNESFVANDSFLIDTIFLSRTYNVVFTGTAGVKGKIKNVEALNVYQTIDGVQLQEGQRVLVKNNSSIENGIYVVGPQSWSRAPDYDGAYITTGTKVWVSSGIVNGGKLFTSGIGNSWSGVTAASNTNDWQEGNFWVHGSELSNYGLTRSNAVQAVRPIIEYDSAVKLNSYVLNGAPSSTGVFFKQVKTQFNQLPLFDMFRYDGTHSGLVSSIFYYVEDLTADLDLDLQKRVKLSTSESADFIFNHGLVDEDGDLLFYKIGSDLKSIWHPGYTSAAVVDVSFQGLGKGEISELIPTTIAIPQSWTLTALSPLLFSVVGSVSGNIGTATVGNKFSSAELSLTITAGTIPFVAGEQFTFNVGAGPTVSTITFVGPIKGSLTNVVPTQSTQQQVWTITAETPTTFKIIGSKAAEIPAPYNTITVGVQYSGLDFSCLITAGTLPYDIGDTFLLRIGNIEIPRYVYRTSDDSIFDFYGGEQADLNKIGSYQIPRPFSYNPYNEGRDEILEGTLYSHFRGILQNQPSGADIDYAFGGAIKNWSEQQTLLASLLMQKDSTPISIIDFAQRQYENGLNAISDLFKQNIIQYISSVEIVDPDNTPEQEQRVSDLLDYLLTLRAKDDDVRTVLYDTTSAVIGFPATLPQLGILPLVQPEISYDTLLGQYLMVHHDGHNSGLYVDDLEFRRSILNNSADLQVRRSDGAMSPAVGSFSSSAPMVPYKGELWIKPVGPDSLMYAFDVDSDLEAPIAPSVGSTWYDRTSNTLSIWDGSSWVAQPDHNSQWRLINLADTLNLIILNVEKRLFSGINPNSRKVDFSALILNSEFNQQLQRELFSFAAINGLDPLGSNYVSTDAFTWNYSSALTSNFAPLSTATVPARWNNILKAHQQTVAGVITTASPNAEPWKLLGFATESDWWATLSNPQQVAYTAYAKPSDLNNGTFINAGYVRVIKTDLSATMLSGLQTIDGVSLVAGDLVALQNELSPANNGVWQVSSGAWTRFDTSLQQNTYITVLEGVQFQGTIWAMSTTVLTPSAITPILFKQVRLWSNQLWVDVQNARPSLKLSVDTVRDTLLPPYVSSTTAQSINALTTVIPSSISASYSFGDNGPVETVWMSSLDFGYGLAKALFRHDPLLFLGYCWGFNWVQVDNILYDAYDINSPGHKRFRLHGDQVRIIDRSSSALSVASIVGTSAIDLNIVFDAYEVIGSARYQNFSIRQNGKIIGYVREGQVMSLSLPSITISNLLIEDSGKPFHIGDSFNISANSNGSNLVVTFSPSTSYKFLGFAQIFTQSLRTAKIDLTDSFAIDAFKNWDVNMGYRAGGLVATDDLAVRTESSTLSSSSYNLIFKKNEFAKDIWVHGLRISVSAIGSTETINGVVVPKNLGLDWQFRIEGYNPRYSNISYFALNTSGQYETFNVLDQSHTDTIWKHFSETVNTVNSYLPISITGIQNVVNFIFGYSMYLESIGWRFNQDPKANIDAETGRSRTWQLEVEKFIDVCYRGIGIDQGHIVNSFMDKIWIQQDTGILSEFVDTALFDITSHPGVFDISGVKMQIADLYVTRGNLVSQFSAAAPMYSAHAQLDEFEHLFIFNNYIEDSTSTGLLYHPFTGSRVVTYKFNGRRQSSQTFRPEFGGHYLVGDDVRQNIQASTDNITNFFDANKAFENDSTTRHALSLLGFNTKEYFDNLDISSKTQFNFWRGLIQSKGTNLSIDAYLNNNRFEDAKIDEYWAYKIAEYGDARQNSYPELKLSVDDSVQQFTQLQFDAAVGDELPNFTQISRFDETRWFSIDDLDQDAYFVSEIIGSYALDVSESTTYVEGELPGIVKIPFVADKLVISGTAIVEQLNATTLKVISGGTLSVVGYGPATPRYNPVKLFNYVDNELVEEIPLWHPAFGQHTPTALECINIISKRNPAKYNYSTQVVNNNTYDPLRPWGSNEIGRIWFDTRNLEYIPYYDEFIFTNRTERLSRWGALADYATVDVYEWVQSSVPPDQYNVLSAEQAGDADLDPATKAAGEVALQEVYSRDREWSIRPIAWSHSARPIEEAHPQLIYGANASESSGKMLFVDTANNLISLGSGLFATLGIEAGMRIGAWDVSDIVPKPRSEAIITDSFTKILVASAEAGALPVSDFPFSTTTISGIIAVSVSAHTEAVGQFAFTPEPNNPIQRIDTTGASIDAWDIPIQLRAWSNDGDIQEVVTLMTAIGTDAGAGPDLYGAEIAVQLGQIFSYQIPSLGLTITVKLSAVPSSGVIAADEIRNVITDTLASNIYARDAVGYSNVTGWVSPVADGFTNDADNAEYDSTCEWRAWSVPTQVELTADSKQPNSSWKAYLGDFISLPAITLDQIQDAVSYSKAPLTLNDGTIIDRYSSTWTTWTVLKNTQISRTQTGTGSLEIPSGLSYVDPEMTSVYLNGIAQLKATYSIIGTSIILNSVSTGSKATVIIRHYEPTTEELAFNPDVADDLTYQRQYKRDYEYVSLPVRDSDGSLSSTLYYFWVKNKSIAAASKKLSIQAVTNDLLSGPPNFLTFQHLIGSGSNSDVIRYDAITISGLSYIVAKDDTFKLRFTRDFTLRDDPQNIDLKDTHTEWSLIRPGQRTKIPEALWQKLTDSVAGEDAAGNVVPALRRVLYDERNGTKTQFGFNSEQTLAPQDLLISSITYTIINTKLINKSVPANPDGSYPADFIEFLNFDESETWFATSAAARKTMTDIWTTAKPSQINEIFFAALDDILASNYELSDIFKTSRLAAYSIKVIAQAPSKASYE